MSLRGEIVCLQKKAEKLREIPVWILKHLVALLDTWPSLPDLCISSPDHPSANTAANDPVLHSVHQEEAQLQSDSDSDSEFFY